METLTESFAPKQAIVSLPNDIRNVFGNLVESHVVSISSHAIPLWLSKVPVGAPWRDKLCEFPAFLFQQDAMEALSRVSNSFECILWYQHGFLIGR